MALEPTALMKLTALMSHSVVLTLSTWRMNLDGSSYSFSLSFTLFTFLDQNENSRVSLSSGKTQLNTSVISHTTVSLAYPVCHFFVSIFSLLFILRNSLAVSLLSGLPDQCERPVS